MSLSLESEILVNYRAILHNLLSGSVISVSVKAVTAGLLTAQEQERCTYDRSTPTEQANLFMQYITHRVSNDPNALVTFITEVLEKEPVFMKTAHEMVAALNNAKAMVEPIQESAPATADQQESAGTKKSGFSENLSVRDLCTWLKSEGVPSTDCAKLKHEQVSGRCFMELADEDMKDLQISFGGRKLISKLQSMPRATQGAAGSSAPPSGNILEISHLRFLVNETWDAHPKWDHVGRGLGIDQSTLESIGAAKRDKPADCYPEMLSTWLRRDGATWEKLLEALESPVIGMQQVATTVRNLPLDKKIKIGYTVPSNTHGVPRPYCGLVQERRGHVGVGGEAHAIGHATDDDNRIDFTEVDDTTVLNIDNNFTEVMDEVGGLAANFVSLGRALHVTHAEIEIIRKRHRDSPKDGLEDVILEWLKQSHDVVMFGKPTWRRLAEAVANPHGGSNCAIAMAIAAKHLGR